MPTDRHLRLRLALSRRAAARRPLALVPVLAVALTAACSDVSSTAPAPRSAASLDKGPSSYATAPKTDTFVYDGQDRTQSFGDGHKVHFDANSVCDPRTSGYGPGTWDLPCTPVTTPITFTVTSSRNAEGRVRVTFSPDVRFVPGTTEVLYLKDAAPGTGSKATIQWCSSLLPQGCVDESLLDSTLSTWVANGAVARRIKHFSGYNVTFGFDSGISTDAY
jgi:hypothetical protein